MRLQLQLILAMCLANFVVTSIQPNDQLVDEAIPSTVNYQSEIRENFQNLFDSIAKNNAKGSKFYRENLKEKITKEQQAFNAMREELSIAQNRNSNRRRNSDGKSYYGENVVAVKRNNRGTRTKEETTKSPVLPDYCGYLEASIRDYNMKFFVNTVNERFFKRKNKRTLPRLMEECLETFDELLSDCEITTKLHEKITRPAVSRLELSSNTSSNRINKKEKMEDVGTIDIRSVNYTDSRLPPIVIKLRYMRSACVSMAFLVKFLNVEMFDNLYFPNERIIILALSFSASGNPAIAEWMALFYQNGEVVGAQKNTTCLDEPEFANLMHKDVPLKEYFTKVYK